MSYCHIVPLVAGYDDAYNYTYKTTGQSENIPITLNGRTTDMVQRLFTIPSIVYTLQHSFNEFIQKHFA
ncbi:hypothetical protein FRX31_004251 [Thalictrum thalictroides]|uniref:Uncharacterized protein n=1 Tax=Thalictrum thalictroides TaxID=46969 RepID=A0A7J6X8P8_THATH|nr:hypothetical protein FRX31_004251 [Thalictrum thalictroides]